MPTSSGQSSDAAPHGRQRLPFPLRALLERMGTHSESHPWAGYLPEHLRSGNVSQPPQQGGAGVAVMAATPVQILQVVSAVPVWTQQVDGGVLPNLLMGGRQDVGVFMQCAGDGSNNGMPAASFCLPVQACPMPTLSLAGRVWALSQDPQGCREVQSAIDSAATNDVRVALAKELRGHIPEALRCPHANHVVQKIIMALRPQDCQFIIDEVMARPTAVGQAARHKYGCRIIQRLVEHCLPQQLTGLIELLLSDASQIARHPYGNYVMQHLLEHGSTDQKRRLVMVLERNVSLIGRDTYGCAVVSAAMCQNSLGHQQTLARAILKEPGLLLFLAHARHGHSAAEVALQTLDGLELEQARQQLTAHLESLRGCRYGRGIAAMLDAAA